MPNLDILNPRFASIFERFDWTDLVVPLFRRCTPRILIVVDGLTYFESDGFGLTRFIQAITTHSAVTLMPQITLAHRGSSPASIPVYGTNHPVTDSFVFNTASPAVTVANFDQVWMFGIQPSSGLSNPFLTDAEIGVIADFMNNGGGVFSTGDHATLGAGMGNRLPRIRQMRDWATVPMGSEALPGVRNRIDTVVNPGSNNLYEFADQSDEIPQRIYPNYSVTGTNPGWTATIHPVLRMPGSPTNRTGPAGFSNDVDAFPDHPHESVCFEVSTTANAAALGGTYNDAGKNFQEYPFVSGSTSLRVGSQIVAFGVSGGRAIDRGDILKPPVNPRMFGIVAAFDGHLATPYANTSGRHPGRIVVDSTWHHFVNINLDGSGSGRNGLGSGSGTAFVPSADLLKVYAYYRNTVDWLQPANRIWCRRFRDFIIVSFADLVFEEAITLPVPPRPADLLALGLQGIAEFEARFGQGTARDAVVTALRGHAKGEALANLLAQGVGDEVESKFSGAVAIAVGRAILDVIALAPDRNGQTFAKSIGKNHEKAEAALGASIVAGVEMGLELAQKRAERQVKALKRFSASFAG